jgi:cell division protein FtsQ
MVKEKSNMLKMFLICFWLVAAAGSVVLLVSAIKDKKTKDCQGFEITLKGNTEQYFLDEKDIQEILTAKGTQKIKGREIKSFDLSKWEKALEKNIWVRDAELFFDNDQVLQVKVWQRQPIARIFTEGGKSFYIDSASVRLPLSDKLSARLPVFTDFPSEKESFSKKDSALINDIRNVSFFLLKNQFWMAQITQIDINPSREFEMVPMIGNHLIEFGNGNDVEAKFSKLMIFYRQVLARTGMDRYARLKIQYDKQVIGVKREGGFSRIDSIQAARSVEQLIASIHNTETNSDTTLIKKSFSVADSISNNSLKDRRPHESANNPNPKQTVTPMADALAKKGAIQSSKQ